MHLAVICDHPPMAGERQPQSNIEIIWSDWVDAIRRGDIDRLAARLTPTTTHQGIYPELICRNGVEVAENARRASGHLPQVDAVELTASGDHVVLGVRGPDVCPTGEEGQAFVVFTLRDGKIVEIRDHPLRAEALAAAGAGDQTGRR